MEREREGLFENPEWHIDSLYSLTPDRVLSVIGLRQLTSTSCLPVIRSESRSIGSVLM